MTRADEMRALLARAINDRWDALVGREFYTRKDIPGVWSREDLCREFANAVCAIEVAGRDPVAIGREACAGLVPDEAWGGDKRADYRNGHLDACLEVEAAVSAARAALLSALITQEVEHGR